MFSQGEGARVGEPAAEEGLGAEQPEDQDQPAPDQPQVSVAEQPEDQDQPAADQPQVQRLASQPGIKEPSFFGAAHAPEDIFF